MKSNYPTFFEQLKTDMERRPEIYRTGYDKYTEQWLGDQGIYVRDPIKSGSFVLSQLTENSFKDRQDTYIQDRLTRQRTAEEERLANRPFFFIFCSRLNKVFYKYLKKN